MTLSARVYYIGVPSRRLLARMAERKKQQAEAGCRRRMAGRIDATEHPKKAKPIASKTIQLTAREVQREAAATMERLRRDNFLLDMNDEEQSAIYALAVQHAQGTLPVQEWLAILADLQRRRALMSAPPKPVRKPYGTGSEGW